MAILARIFVILAALCMISAFPTESEVNKQQINLSAVKSLRFEDAITGKLTRDKRHLGFGYGNFIFLQHYFSTFFNHFLKNP
jgi:hypothetical protein